MKKKFVYSVILLLMIQVFANPVFADVFHPVNPGQDLIKIFIGALVLTQVFEIPVMLTLVYVFNMVGSRNINLTKLVLTQLIINFITVPIIWVVNVGLPYWIRIFSESQFVINMEHYFGFFLLIVSEIAIAIAEGYFLYKYNANKDYLEGQNRSILKKFMLLSFLMNLISYVGGLIVLDKLMPIWAWFLGIYYSSF